MSEKDCSGDGSDERHGIACTELSSERTDIATHQEPSHEQIWWSIDVMTLEYEEVVFDTENRKEMGTTRKKMNLEVGVKYRGTGWVSEYGEMNFIPEQKGSKPNNMKLVKETDDFSLYESKDYLKVTIKIPKGNSKGKLISQFMKSYTNAVLELKKYEI